MKNHTIVSAGKKAVRVLAILLILAVMFSASAVSASAYYHDVKGRTLADVLGMDGVVYYRWLTSHINDTYYNTTPYAHADHRNPNGDCDGANGSLDTPGVPALNCMGFVWHALYMPTKMSGGNTGMIPAYGKGGWYGLYTNYNITRRYFSSSKELLESGYAERGDIIWMFVQNEHVSDDSNHICIYMGDGHSDLVWHSVKAGCKFGSLNPTYEEYCVIKSGVIAKLETPTLKSVSNTASGAKLTWNKVPGATWYRVFVKNGNKWKVLGNTKNNYIVDKTAKSGQKTTYTVRCVDYKGKFMSDYNENGITNTFYAAPGGFAAQCSEQGIQFSWNAVDGAAKYRVYRRTAGNDWEVVAKTTATTFLDTNVQKAKPYLYTVRTLDEKGKTVSAFRTPLKAYIISEIPQISSDTVGTAGVTLTWNKIKGAEQYAILKKNGTSWKKIGTSATNSFTYKTPDKNVESTYTVRCLSSTGNAYTSGYDRVGYKVMYNDTPEVTRMEAQADGILLAWSEREGAAKYRIYRKNNGGAWTKLADTTELSYKDTTAEVGETYTYTVRCVTADGKKLTSGFNTKGWTMTVAETPVITVTAVDNGINVGWEKDANAPKYRVFIRKDGAWKTLTTTADSSYLYTDVADGQQYTFTVRAVDANKRFNSNSAVSASATYVDPNGLAEVGIDLAEVGAEAELVTEPATDAPAVEAAAITEK